MQFCADGLLRVKYQKSGKDDPEEAIKADEFRQLCAESVQGF